MTESRERTDPSAALETTFRHIHLHQMQDMPMVNPALRVEAVGFRPWNEHWLGVLVTPWFMNLMLLPRVPTLWQPIGEGETRHYVFPAGVFEFIGGRNATVGDYQACSLFSPMFEFATHAGAHDTAIAALATLFNPATREAGEVEKRPRSTPPAAARPVSKRDFLFGSGTKPGSGADDGT